MIRIGLIVPANNVAMEYDLYKLSPDNISFHSTRMKPSKGCEPKDPEKFRRELKETYNLLRNISNIVVYGRTYGTHKNIDIINDVIKKKLIIPELAVIDYLKDNNINKMFIGTPYIKERNIEESKYYINNGFNVSGYDGLNKIYGLDISNTKENEIIDLLNKNDDKIKSSDTIYLACTALPTYNILNKIKSKYNIPVISENSAILYEISKMLNYKFFIPGL